jgi:hypothetical protein
VSVAETHFPIAVHAISSFVFKLVKALIAHLATGPLMLAAVTAFWFYPKFDIEAYGIHTGIVARIAIMHLCV